jgi:hypothetical protein
MYPPVFAESYNKEFGIRRIMSAFGIAIFIFSTAVFILEI